MAGCPQLPDGLSAATSDWASVSAMPTEIDPSDAAAAVPTLRVRGPADLAQAIPYLLGFHPSRSLVLLGLAGVRVVVSARLDLADVVDPVAAHLLPNSIAAMIRGGAEKFVGVVFDDDAMPRPRVGRRPLPWNGVAAELADAVEQGGAAIDDVLLVSRRRMWSYTCDDPDCCPPEGQPLEQNSEVAAAATFAGLVALPDRASLAALLDPLPDAERDRLIPALDAAEHAATGMILRGDDARADRSVIRAIFAASRSADEPEPPAELGESELIRFAIALQRISVRDSVWMAVDDRRLDGRELWRQLARRLPAPFDAPALFLFAWRAWRGGDGALANIAAERALDSDPAYSAADLLLAALSRGIDPRQMPRLRMRKAG
jgi:hypothetical protein